MASQARLTFLEQRLVDATEDVKEALRGYLAECAKRQAQAGKPENHDHWATLRANALVLRSKIDHLVRQMETEFPIEEANKLRVLVEIEGGCCQDVGVTDATGNAVPCILILDDKDVEEGGNKIIGPYWMEWVADSGDPADNLECDSSDPAHLLAAIQAELGEYMASAVKAKIEMLLPGENVEHNAANGRLYFGRFAE